MSTYYRHLIEMSQMCNNDEYVMYTESIDPPTIPGNMIGMFDTPRVVMSRRVHDSEDITDIECKLGKMIRVYEKESDDTEIYDTLAKLRKFVEFSKLCEMSSSKAIAFRVANQYYDCMSGGMSVYEMVLLYNFCKRDDIDKNEKVYPNSNESGKWYTIKDFIESVEKDHPDVVSKEGILIKLLNCEEGMKLLPVFN